MRNEYYKFLQENNIADILSLISELSYTQKQNLLNLLKEKFDNNSINYALNNYKLHYIDKNRIDLKRIKGILIYFAKQIH
jgi:hypothetical protein